MSALWGFVVVNASTRPVAPDRARSAVAGAGMTEEMDDPDPVVLPIEDALDLHAFAPRDIPSVVEEYLGEAARRGFTEVRLIHGRGKGVQRAIVHGLLARHPLSRGSSPRLPSAAAGAPR
jgi:dsDNA-specific endonuclease/ATPase MutS2